MMSATPIPRTLAMTLLRRPRSVGDRRIAAGAHAGRHPLIDQERRDEVIERVHAAARKAGKCIGCAR